MGQLETYTMQDIFLTSISANVLTTYFAEEIEAGVESIASYLYTGGAVRNKKRAKLLVHRPLVGDNIGAMHKSFNTLGISGVQFIAIERPLDEKKLWKDLFLMKWAGELQENGTTEFKEDENNKEGNA